MSEGEKKESRDGVGGRSAVPAWAEGDGPCLTCGSPDVQPEMHHCDSCLVKAAQGPPFHMSAREAIGVLTRTRAHNESTGDSETLDR